MKRILLIWGLVIGMVYTLLANPIKINTAEKLAKNFYIQHMDTDFFPGIRSTDIIKYQGVNSFFAINMNNHKGFILIAADDGSMPILGYSFQGSYDRNNQSENFTKTIEDYQAQIKYIQDNNILATDYIKKQWKDYLNTQSQKGTSSTIGPLLSTIWSQGCYYNDSTPVDVGGSCGHAVTGCVATAMGQVLNYHKYPSKGSGTHSYNSSYGPLTANFGSTFYNWLSMADSLDSQSAAVEVSSVAQLLGHCGIAVEMMYSAGGSGAYSQDAANAIAHYFNYDSGLKLLHRNSYPDSIWEQMIKTEVDSLRPVYYDGSGTGGHAFVCDGYQGDHYFHFNWGWSGSHNGYYLLSALNPGGMNFSVSCGAIFGVKPGVQKNCNGLTDTLIAKAANISDGSYDLNYQDNNNCSWFINPPNAMSITLDFYTFDLIPGDSVYIYDGSSSTSPLIGAYSGKTIPQSIASSSNMLFIQFVSDNTTNSGGWSAFYRSEYCDGLKVFNNQSGTIVDGSSSELYNDNTNCYWLINDSLNRGINLSFTEFQTEQNYDFVDVYDGNSSAHPLLGSFSGNQLPQVLNAVSGHMFIHFHSDGGVTDQGWKANYYICGNIPALANASQINLCQGESSSLVIPTNVDSFMWVYNGVAQQNINSKTWNITQPGIYQYIAYSDYCPTVSSDSVVVNINPLPSIDLGQDTVLCTTQVLQLQANSSFSNYLWSTGDTTNSIFVDSTSGNTQLIHLSVKDINSCENQDSILVQFQYCASVNNLQISDLDINIYPNPSTEILNIEFSITIDWAEIHILDMQGKLVQKSELRNSNKYSVNLNKLNAGIYSIVFIIDQKRYQRVFIKE